MIRSERINLLIHAPYPLGTGSPSGVSDYICEAIPHLEAKGFNVTTIAPTQHGQTDKADYHLGRVVPYPVLKTRVPAGFSFNKLRARESLQSIEPDIIVTHEPAVPNTAHTIISAIPKDENGKRIAPVVGVFHSVPPGGKLDLPTRLYGFIASTVVRRPRFNNGIPVGMTQGYRNTIDRALTRRYAISKGTRRHWEKQVPGDYDVMYNGIETSQLTPEGSTFEEWKKEGRKVILAAGRHDKRKGFDDLLMAYASLRRSGADELVLKITGHGDETQNLMKLIDRENIPDVEFLGFLTREDLIKAYRTADVVVASSIGGEGFNRTIPEARSCGTLVVCTNIDGQNEAIGVDLVPFMAEPSDPQGLAQKIFGILNLPEEGRADLSVRTSKDVRKNFAWEIIAEQNRDYFEKVMDSYGKKPNWHEYQSRKLPLAGVVFVSDTAKRRGV